MPKECLQPDRGTPCFEEVERTVCSLDFCPVARCLGINPKANLWKLLHTRCVMSDTYEGDEGKREFIATIAWLASLRLRR